MDNIGQLSNSFEQMRRTIWQACHPNHEKKRDACRRMRQASLQTSLARSARRRQYFSMMSGEAMYTMIWSVPSAIWLPRQSCHSWLTRAPSVYPMPVAASGT